MEVQIENYLQKPLEYKKRLFIHGAGNIFKDMLAEIKKFRKNKYLLFLKKFGLSYRIFYFYELSMRGIPVDLFFKIVFHYKKITGKDPKEIIEKVFTNFSGISSKNSKPIKLPRVYSNELAYLCGFILGDGHVSRRLEVVIWEETEGHTAYISKLIEKLFNYKPT